MKLTKQLAFVMLVSACRGGAPDQTPVGVPAIEASSSETGPKEAASTAPVLDEADRPAAPPPRPTDPEVLRFVQALEYARDPAHWAVFARQPPVRGFKSITRFPDLIEIPRFDSATMYAVNHDRWAGGGSLNHAVEGCLIDAVASDGTLCPSIVLPGRSLSIDLAERFIELFAEASPHEHVMCGQAPEIALIFRRGEVPVGAITFSTHCTRWSAYPGPYMTITGNIRDRLWELCREADEPLCRYREDPVVTEGSSYYWATHPLQTEKDVDFLMDYKGRIPPRAIRLDTNKRLDALTYDERLELCVWNTEHLSRYIAPGPDEMRGFKFPGVAGTRLIRGLPFNECIDRFPVACEQRVEEILPCIDIAQRGDATFALPEHKACLTLKECIWGFETKVDFETKDGLP